MKNKNLLNRLWTDSHEKQSPQRFGRYAAMLLMLLTLGVGQMWGADANFKKGSYLYLDISSVTGWSGGADIVAIFYYADNTKWCYETNTEYTPKNACSGGQGATSLGGNIYRVTVPDADVKEMYFLRKEKSTSNVYNYSAKMTKSGAGEYNNCVKLNDWDNNSSWTRYDDEYRYVAGDSWGGLSSWSADASSGKMTQSGSTYTWTSPSSVSASSDHKFKIAGYKWGCPLYAAQDYNSSGSHNIKSTSGSGTGDLTFQTYVAGKVIITLNASTGKFTIDAPRTITFNEHGATTSGTTSIAATYGATAENISCPAKTGGYSFDGYYTSENGAGTKVINADGSWVSTVSGYTSSGKYAATLNQTLHANWVTETLTTVTLAASPSGAGTFTVGGSTVTSTSAGTYTTPSVTAVPRPGYRVNTSSTVWTKSNNNITLSSTTANPVTVTGSGSGGTSTLTATFTRTYAYVVGRFHIWNSSRSGDWTNSFSSGNWATDCANIQFQYDETSHQFYLHTYAKPSELKSQIDNNDPYFHVRMSTSSSEVNGTEYYPGSNNDLTLAKKGQKQTVGTSGSNNFKFTSTDENGYVVLFFDQSNLWYDYDYTLTYNGNGNTGGSVPASSGNFYLNGTNATAASNSYTKSNYVFAGWNTHQYITGANYAAGASVPMTANTTLYAKWTRSVTLNRNTATTGSESVTAAYNCSTLQTSITNPSKDGYSFGGWYTANDGSGSLVINTSKQLQSGVSGWTTSNRFTRTESDATLYAKWTQTVTLNANTANHGSTGGTATIIYKATGKSSISHCTPAAGYHLAGYYTDATDGTMILDENGDFAGENITDYITSGKWTKDGDTELYAHYEPNTYDVILDVNGATSGSNQTVTATFGAAMPTTQKTSGDAITAPEKTGYAFGGYTKNSNGTGTQYYTDALASNHVWDVATDNTHIYAKWTARSYTVTLSQSEETGYGSSGSKSTVSATYNSAMPSMGTAPVGADGYKFQGYYSGENGTGTQYYDADGTSVHTWDIAEATILHAYFQPAAVTSIAVSPNVVAQGVTITATPTISPIPEGTTMICWRVLYSNSNPLDVQPTFRQGPDNSVLFAAPETSASYKIEAKLYTGSTCDEGTLLSTTTADFQVAGLHKVTVRYKCGDEVISDPTTLEGIRPLDWSEEIPAPSIFGYTFNGWTAGDGVSLTDDDGSTTKTSTDKDHPNIKIKANYDGYLTASYTQKNIIYFKNTLGWGQVYVNLLTGAWWDSDQGTGNESLASDKKNKQMSLVPGTTDIYYYEYGSTGTTTYVSFVDRSQDNYHGFEGTTADPVRVCYPTIPNPNNSQTEMNYFGFYSKTPMFVPASTYGGDLWNHSKAKYFNAGYWTKYTPGTGYYLRIYDPNNSNTLIKRVEFTSENDLIPMTLTTNLEANKTYFFEIEREEQQYYSNGDNTMTYANRWGQGTAWELYRPSTYKKTKITTTAAGDYIFHLTHSNNGSGVWRLRIAPEYPIKSGDYRLIYTDETRSFMEDAVKKYRFKPSAIVSKENGGSDIVSFFVRPGSTPVLRIQQATVAADGSITWAEYPTSGTPTNQITGAIASAISSGGTKVYNFNLSMDGSGNLSVVSAEPYTGNYYIRTDVANSKWDNWTSDPDHLMTYSEYSIEHGGYSHYYCHWVKTGDKPNVKFCIANDYSPCISDTLTRETNTGTWANINSHIDASGNVTTDANVRFMWNQADNTISRAYVDGAQGTGSNNFLYILSEDGKITKSNGSALDDNKVNFSDNENWIYEANLKVQPNAEIKLLSNWGSSNMITQYFKGSSSKTDKLIGGSGTDWYDIRVVYDFKTNRLISTWIPSEGEITTDRQIEADVMFIREHQGDIAQLTFGESGKISKIKTAYGVLRLNKWTLANKSKEGGHSALLDPKSIYERSLYWISFPFRVKLSEVLAFGAYGTHWAVQRYDGAGRAAKGHFLENGSFWKWMDRNTEYLEPNQGYLLAVDLDLLGEESDVWGPNSRSSQLEIYFPSYGTMPDITNADVEQTITPHVCEINRAATEGLPDTGNPRTSYNRTIFDSHWNVMSVPTYVNTKDVTFANSTWTSTIGPNFLYTWNPDDNTITATLASGYTYHAMHAYMVQYGGTVTWRASSGSPASIVARRTYAEKPSKVEFRLELQQNEKMIDRTYVVLSSDEDVSSEFRFGEDMTKEFNANKANIYTKIDYLGVAGNTLPMSEQTTVVPVGVEIKTNGDYTFTMPDGTEGIGVTLVDNESGVRTNLGLTDYVVTLSKGDYVDRFALEISPIKQMPTDIENADASVHDAVRKVVVDGILYIVKEGVVFDARGNRVK